MYKVVGKIDRWNDIPWDVPTIVSGSSGGNSAWFWRMPGVFRKDNGRCWFIDDFGCSSTLEKDGLIALNVLERLPPRP